MRAITLTLLCAGGLLLLGSRADAAKLVVLAIDSGSDTSDPYVNTQSPNLPPGTRGFLIGIDLQTDAEDVPIGVQNLQFTNVIHQQGQLDELGDPLPTPLNIKTRSQAQLQQVIDSSLLGGASNPYLRSDSYVMDNAQQGSYVWTPVGPGIEGGAAGDNFLRITASLGLPSQIDGPGPVQFAYIVAREFPFVEISGIIAVGNQGFDPLGFPAGQSPQGYYILQYDGDLLFIPEPTSIVLAAVASLVALVGACRRRRLTVRCDETPLRSTARI